MEQSYDIGYHTCLSHRTQFCAFSMALIGKNKPALFVVHQIQNAKPHAKVFLLLNEVWIGYSSFVDFAWISFECTLIVCVICSCSWADLSCCSQNHVTSWLSITDSTVATWVFLIDVCICRNCVSDTAFLGRLITKCDSERQMCIGLVNSKCLYRASVIVNSCRLFC